MPVADAADEVAQLGAQVRERDVLVAEPTRRFYDLLLLPRGLAIFMYNSFHWYKLYNMQ
jgi:hypothetical protein